MLGRDSVEDCSLKNHAELFETLLGVRVCVCCWSPGFGRAECKVRFHLSLALHSQLVIPVASDCLEYVFLMAPLKFTSVGI